MVATAPYADRLAICLELFKAAMRCEQLTHALAGRRVIQPLGKNSQHIFKRRNQLFAQLALARLY